MSRSGTHYSSVLQRQLISFPDTISCQGKIKTKVNCLTQSECGCVQEYCNRGGAGLGWAGWAGLGLRGDCCHRGGLIHIQMLVALPLRTEPYTLL